MPFFLNRDLLRAGLCCLDGLGRAAPVSGEVDWEEVKELITHSYLLVAPKRFAAFAL